MSKTTHIPIRRASGVGRLILSICVAAFVLPAAFSGGAIATPELGKAFNESGPALSWVVNAFMLTFGALPMVAGALADRLGRRLMLRIGLLGFIITRLVLMVAPSLVVIDLIRALQGMFAAATLAGGISTLAQLPDEGVRRRAFSVIGARQ